MATGGLYGSSGTGALIAQPGSESSGLYGNSTSFGGTYFEWFVFQTSETQPATPTGGTWNFTTNANTPPTGWSSAPPSNPLNTVWVSIAIVNSKNTAPLVWSVPGKFAFSSGLPILFGNGAPQPGDGQSDQLYVQLDTTPQTIWAKETGTWTRLTGSTLYADLTSNQTIAGTKTFSSQIQGSISGTASNVTGTVAISNGGTGATTAASARAALGAAELGANADITSMTGVTGGISTPDFVQFDTGITPTVGVGKLQWDPTHGCMQVGLVGGNVNLQIGEETVAYVYNNTGSTITEGQVVRVVGSQGQRLTVALAQADGDPNSATILGMATENIANNSSGFITTQGVVNNLNTNGFADGTLLYLSPTVPGGVTATKPVAPQHLVWIGYVVKGNSGGAGSIYIHTQNGYELDELHNVKITDPVADNSFLVYDATLEVWQNEAPSAARTSLGLGSAAVLNAGAANGVATLDAGGTVPLSQIPASIQGGVSYQGTWNATTNTPTLTSSVGTKGYYYVVSVAGSTNLNGITSWNIGDWAIYNGTAWEKIDNTDAVTSVNGYTGTVVLNYADVGAPSTTGVNATGTWNINVTGNAATATTAGSATTATTATNVSGGTASVTTLTTSSTVTLNGGTANGVAYLNGSKVLTTGSALTFDGTNLTASGYIGAGSYLNVSANAGYINFSGSGTASAPAGLSYGSFLNSGVGLVNFSAASQAFWANSTEQMRLTSTGLGIGTSSPGQKLAVAGDGNFVRLTATDTFIQAANSVATFNITQSANGSTYLYNYGAYNLYFGTGASTKMTLDSSGNLGLGVTPTTGGYGKGYQFSDSSGDTLMTLWSQAINTDDRRLSLTNNAKSSGVYSWAYYNTGASASMYQQVGGEHRFLRAAPGTAGNAISFTQAMTLDASGRLLIGTTSSNGTANNSIQLAGGSNTGRKIDLYSDANTHMGLGIDLGGGPYEMDVYFTDGSGSGSLRFGKISSANPGTWSELARIDSSGNLGIGTSSPVCRLHVDRDGPRTLSLSPANRTAGGASYILMGNSDSGGSTGPSVIVSANRAMQFGVGTSFNSDTGGTFTEYARIESSGNLLVGTTSNTNSAKVFALATSSGPAFACQGYSGDTATPAALFGKFSSTTTTSQVFVRFTANNNTAGSGQINADGAGGAAFGAFSDARLKENIADLSPQLGNICALRPVEFDYIQSEGGGHQTGFIAQEMQAVYPDAVGERAPDGMLTITGWSKTDARLVKAIQEQQAIIQTLTARVAALESN